MKNFLKWSTGIVLFILGISSISSEMFISAIGFLFGGLICIPPILIIIEEKLNFTFKTYQKYFLVLFGVFIGGIFSPESFTNDLSDKSSIISKVQNLTTSQKDSLEKSIKEEIDNNTVSAKQLVSIYEQNEVDADNKLKGRVFYVTGEITSIKKDILNDIYVTLDGGGTFREVQCYFGNAEEAGKLKKGLLVTFKGKCDGLMGNVLMKDCELIKQ